MLAIRRSLVSGRQIIVDEVRKHYMIPAWFFSTQVGEPKVSGLMGLLSTKGSRAPVLFPHRDVYPGGVTFEEVKGHASTMGHSFIHGHKGKGKVWQRPQGAGHDIPLQTVVGLSVPEMASPGGAKDVVGEKVTARIEERVDIELDNLITSFAHCFREFSRLIKKRIRRSDSL
jgi:hypothetical protein